MAVIVVINEIPNSVAVIIAFLVLHVTNWYNYMLMCVNKDFILLWPLSQFRDSNPNTAADTEGI